MLKLSSLDKKIKLMAEKGKLRGMDLWLDDDLTRREAEIIQWLEREIKAQKAGYTGKKKLFKSRSGRKLVEVG